VRLGRKVEEASTKDSGRERHLAIVALRQLKPVFARKDNGISDIQVHDNPRIYHISILT